MKKRPFALFGTCSNFENYVIFCLPNQCIGSYFEKDGIFFLLNQCSRSNLESDVVFC